MQKKEICWNITTRCNQGCRYCHRFLNINDLTFNENEKILNNLINDGVTDITWTGGEALIYKNIEELIKRAYKKGIRNKLITNGKILANSNMRILNYLDSLTLSLDSTNNKINQELGRGEEHYTNVKYILDYIKENNIDIKLRINTVATKLNIDNISEFILFLNEYNIYAWRIFRFMPLRETAVKNKNEFEISDEQFKFIKEKCNKECNITNIEYREEDDMEKKYVLLVANGDIVITENGKDVTKGNALFDKVSQYM